VEFQAFTLAKSHHLLAILSCENACENLDAVSARFAVCFCSQYCSWARSHRGRHCYCFFYIAMLLMHTNTTSIEAE